MKANSFHLTAGSRAHLLLLIAYRLGLSENLTSARTDAQLVALLRDLPHCQYHLHALDGLRPLHDIHHTLGRLPSQDWPQYCIGLCAECHRRVENGLGCPDRQELIELAERLTRAQPNRLLFQPSPSH